MMIENIPHSLLELFMNESIIIVSNGKDVALTYDKKTDNKNITLIEILSIFQLFQVKQAG